MDHQKQNADKQDAAIKFVRIRLGVPELRGTGVSELRLIASVNESIKQAIDASANISLIAVNANLVAGRSGTDAAGFCIVANELRRFSDSMAASMLKWSGLIYELVRATAANRNQARRLYKLHAAARLSPKAAQAIVATRLRSEHALAVISTLNSERVIELQNLMSRAEKQHMTGVVIARSAMIESAYGGSMQPVLQQIAESIDAAIRRFTEHSAQVGNLMAKATA